MENHSQSHKPIYGKGSVTAFTDTAGSTAVLPVGCTAIWVLCTAAAYVKVGVYATATSVDLPLPANTPFLISLDGEPEAQRVSAVQISTGGNLHVMPLVY